MASSPGSPFLFDPAGESRILSSEETTHPPDGLAICCVGQREEKLLLSDLTLCLHLAL
jgi:hypothetical protein